MALGSCMSTPFDRLFAGWNGGAAHGPELIRTQEFVKSPRRPSRCSMGLRLDQFPRVSKCRCKPARDLETRERIRGAGMIDLTVLITGGQFEQNVSKCGSVNGVAVLVHRHSDRPSRIPR